MLSRTAIVDKSYQLEELEDSVDCISALYLRGDGTVAHGRTDGPQPDRVDGEWLYNENERELVMQLERHFKEGNFSFSVKRVLRGHLDAKDGAELAVFAGSIFQDTRDIGDASAAVGQFSMCVATDDLPDEHYNIAEDGN